MPLLKRRKDMFSKCKKRKRAVCSDNKINICVLKIEYQKSTG
jgi:hypothetical protein